VAQFQFIARNVDDLPHIAQQLLESTSSTRIFTFSAGMGAGKTTFIQALLKAMGIENPDGSPTYSLVNIYESNFYGSVYHFDLYRLNKIEEAFDIGIEDILYNGDYCFIEWPQIIEQLLPEDNLAIHIHLNDNLERLISWETRD
jgi:tRNA threonylcarbamoyladenosine biosynthesis protein TsaE